MRVIHEHKVYFDISPELAALMRPLLTLPVTLKKLETHIMSTLSEIKAEQAKQKAALADIATAQGAIATSITDAAGDIDEILAKLAAAPPDSPEAQEILEEAKTLTAGLGASATTLTEQAASLAAVAAKYPAPA